MRRVIVNIDNLVLKGFRYEDRHAVSAALQEELARILTAPDMPGRLTEFGDRASLRIDSVNIGVNAKPHQIGAETGRAVGKGLIK